MRSRLLVGFSVALLLLAAWRSLFVVGQDQSALRLRFGQIEGGVYAAGLHLKSPLDQVRRFDARLITSSYVGEAFASADQQPLQIDYYLQWRLADVTSYYLATGGDEHRAARRLEELSHGPLAAALAHASLAAIAGESRAGLDDAALAALRRAARALGIEVADLQVQHIGLSDEAAASVYARMEERFNTQARQLADAAKLQSEAVRSAAERDRATILAGAARRSQKIHSSADAQASMLLARAFRSDPEFAAFTQSLAAYRSTLGQPGDLLLVTPSGEFFKYLRSAGGH